MCPAAQGDADPPCLPLRGRWQREALAEGEIPHGFLSPSRLRRQPPPRGGLPARHCRADGTSYPKDICSAALHCGTPSPTFVIRQARLSLRRGRCPHRPAVGNRIPAAGHAGPALQGVCVRADRVVRRDGISTGTRAVEHQGTHRGSGQRRATAHRGKLWRHNPLNRKKTGKPVARGTGQREIIADAREEVLKRSFKRRFW